jgi:hypothetical protein
VILTVAFLVLAFALVFYLLFRYLDTVREEGSMRKPPQVNRGRASTAAEQSPRAPRPYASSSRDTPAPLLGGSEVATPRSRGGVGLAPTPQLSDLVRPSSMTLLRDAVGRCTISVPSIRYPPLKPRASLNRMVCNAAGKGLFSITVTGPSTDIPQLEPGTPEEYVTITSFDQRVELSLWLMTAAKGGGWECHCFREGKHLGYFSETTPAASAAAGQDHIFALKTVRESFQSAMSILTVEGDLTKPPLRVLQEGQLSATVDPAGDGSFGASDFCQVTCEPEVDLGLIVLALIGMDRLLGHNNPALRPSSVTSLVSAIRDPTSARVPASANSLVSAPGDPASARVPGSGPLLRGP